MTPLAPTRPPRQAVPASPLVCRVRLAPGLGAPQAARAVLETTMRAWHVPADRDVAALLTSELVANAVTHGAGPARPARGFVTLAITCTAARLRVDVHDGSADLPLLASPSPEAETGRGLLLVTSLSAEWGFYRTARGKAVYFTLEFPPGVRDFPPGARANAGGPSRPGAPRSVS